MAWSSNWHGSGTGRSAPAARGALGGDAGRHLHQAVEARGARPTGRPAVGRQAGDDEAGAQRGQRRRLVAEAGAGRPAGSRARPRRRRRRAARTRPGRRRRCRSRPHERLPNAGFDEEQLELVEGRVLRRAGRRRPSRRGSASPPARRSPASGRGPEGRRGARPSPRPPGSSAPAVADAVDRHQRPLADPAAVLVLAPLVDGVQRGGAPAGRHDLGLEALGRPRPHGGGHRVALGRHVEHAERGASMLGVVGVQADPAVGASGSRRPPRPTSAAASSPTMPA